jgi:hypothetical protein
LGERVGGDAMWLRRVVREPLIYVVCYGPAYAAPHTAT